MSFSKLYTNKIDKLLIFKTILNIKNNKLNTLFIDIKEIHNPISLFETSIDFIEINNILYLIFENFNEDLKEMIKINKYNYIHRLLQIRENIKNIIYVVDKELIWVESFIMNKIDLKIKININ